MQTATAAIALLQSDLAAYTYAEACAQTPPVGPFTVECSFQPWTVTGIERFASAALTLASLRKNQPRSTFTLLDADGYIVPSYAIRAGLRIMLTEAKAVTEAAENYLAHLNA